MTSFHVQFHYVRTNYGPGTMCGPLRFLFRPSEFEEMILIFSQSSNSCVSSMILVFSESFQRRDQHPGGSGGFWLVLRPKHPGGSGGFWVVPRPKHPGSSGGFWVVLRPKHSGGASKRCLVAGVLFIFNGQ